LRKRGYRKQYKKSKKEYPGHGVKVTV